MKLRREFITQDIDDTLFLIPVGVEDFTGIVRSNPTAAFIVNLLKNDISKEKIVEAMRVKYDAPAQTIEEDVEEILETLRKIHALEE